MRKFLFALLLAGLVTLLFPLTALADGITDGFSWADNGDNTVTITGYSGSGGDIVIPSQIDGKDVAAIGDYSLANHSEITRVTIPDTVVTIGDGAFQGCDHLTGILIPKGVARIGGVVFANDTSLAAITVSPDNACFSSQDGVLFNKDRTWLIFCPQAKTGAYTIPDSVTCVKIGAFGSCSLASVAIPASVSSIEADVFTASYNLTAINVDASNAVYSSQGGVLFNKDGKTLLVYPGGKTGAYTIPGGVAEIAEESFVNCLNLTAVTIPSSVTAIRNAAFLETGISEVFIPAGVTTIETCAFACCDSLSSIVVDDANTAYASKDGVLYSKDMTELLSFPAAYHGEFTVPDGVVEIGDEAFQSCLGLTDVKLPSSLETLGVDAFTNCTFLASAEIPSVKSIGIGAFGNTALKSVVLPAGLESVDRSAFQSCASLSGAIFLGNAPDPFGDDVFADCAKDFTIYYPKGATGWSDPFHGYRAREFELGATYAVTYDANGATAGTVPTDANTYKFGDDVTVLGNSGGLQKDGFAFAGWNTLPDGTGQDYAENDTFPMGVDNVTLYVKWQKLLHVLYDGNGATGGMPPVDSNGYKPGEFFTVLGPGTLQRDGCRFKCWTLDKEGAKGDYYEGDSMQMWNSDGDLTFYAKWEHVSNDFVYDTVEGGIEITGYVGAGGAVTIPSEIDDLPVVSVGDSAFARVTSVTSVSVPSGVVNIGVFAFGNCSALKSVSLPDTLTQIGSAAFFGCQKLAGLTLPKGVSTLGEGVVQGCTALKAITVAAANQSFAAVGGAVLSKDTKTLVVCPPGKSGSYTAPSTVQSLANSAFSGCAKLTSITLPAGLKSIGSAAFNACSGLTGVTIPENVGSIGDFAFVNCAKLTQINVAAANKVYSSLGGVLYDKAQKTLVAYPTGRQGSFAVPAGVETIGKLAFAFCPGLTDFSLPASVKTIGPSAFEGCSGLSQVFVSGGVTQICDSAFDYCKNLAGVTLGPSVSSIEVNAFASCEKLVSACFLGGKPDLDSEAFYGDGGGFTVFYPESEASSWSGYTYNNATPCWVITYDLQYGGLTQFCFAPTTQAHAAPPATPARPGYIFDGWYKEPSCSTLFDFDTESVSSDFRLYAGWAVPSADLSGISLSAGSLSPAFSPSVTSYTVAIGETVGLDTVTPLPLCKYATLTIDKVEQAYEDVKVDCGESVTVTINVACGTLTKTYKVKITRAKSTDNTLASLTATAGVEFDHDFDPGVTAYTLTLPEGMPTATITAVKNSPYAAITNAVKKITLKNGGSTAYTVSVKSQTGVTKNYVITVTRKKSSNADLASLKTSSTKCALDKPFSKDTLEYTISMPSSVKSFKLTAKAVDANAKITINGKAAASVTIKGAGTYDIWVTAQDGSVKKYKVTVVRS